MNTCVHCGEGPCLPVEEDDEFDHICINCGCYQRQLKHSPMPSSNDQQLPF